MPPHKFYVPALWILSAGLAWTQTGVINTYAGNGFGGYSGDGAAATSAWINGPAGLALDSNGNLFIADGNNSRIRKVSSGIITTVAGGGIGGDGGLATAAQLQSPCDVKVDSAGNLYISESCTSASSGTGSGGSGGSVVNRIRRVDAATGIITTIAGGVIGGFAGDGGPAANALLNTPGGLALDGSGNIYIADSGNNRIRRIDAMTGVITTVAGNGAAMFGGDGGPAIAANLNTPTAVALDAANNLYIADWANSRIRRVDAVTGIITTVAGSNSNSYNGDGIAATSAGIGFPFSLLVNADGNLVFTDFRGNRVRLVDTTTGLIWTIAGNGIVTGCCTGDGGQATLATLNAPAGLALSPMGPLFVAEHSGQRIRQVALQSPLVSDALNATASGASVPYGSPLTLTAVLSVMRGSPANATGNILLVEGFNLIGSVPLVNGSSSFTTSSLQMGAHTLSAQYAGDTVFGAMISQPLSVTITAAQSSVALAASPNPAVANQPLTLTATVTPSTATGSVTFFNGTTSLGMANVTNGTAVLPGITLGAGSYSLTAQYSGNINLPSSTSPAMSLTVKALSSLTLSSSVNPATVGQAVTFTATVNPSTANGNIHLIDNGVSISTTMVVFGTATFPISSLTVGSHSITVSYDGDANNSSATSAALIENVLSSSSVIVTSSQNPAPVGAPVTFTASVNPGTATGTVQFLDGKIVLGTVALAGGSASFTTSTLAPATHSITAVYSGDASNATATSVALSQSVKLSPGLTLASNQNPSTAGQSVTFTASLNTAATGTLQFLDGVTVLATLPANSGTGVYQTSALTVGTHSITVVYSGDANYLNTQSAAVIQTVNQVVTTTTVSSTQNPAFAGGSVTFNVTVTPPTATGTVQFFDGAVLLGTRTLANGSTALAASALTQGDHAITAVYSGDTTNAGSTSAILTQSMKLSAGMTSGLNPSPGVTGRNVTLTANVVAAATGTVTFTDGGAVLGTVPVTAGTASYSTTALTQGAHTLGISYSGDATYMSQSTTVAETILGATSITVTSNANPATPGQTITFTATVTPPAATGSVQFYDGQNLVATVTLSAGTASYSTSSFTSGNHSITANYLGSSDYAQSFSNTLIQIVKANTSVALGSTPNPAFVGGGVAFIATVTPAIATGTVQFFDGATVLGTATLAGGSASFSTSALTQGDHSITAVYSGDTANAGSSSAVLTQSMRLSAGMTTGLNPSPGVTGRNVTLTANVVAAATGTVTFTDGGAVLATVPVTAGTASYSTTSLTQGAHILGISYSGDSTYMTQSTTVVETILGATSVTVTSNANPASPGQSITLTATVTPAAASGSVQFYDGQTLVATVALSSGTASYSTASLAPGNHSMTANYLGSSDYAQSFSNTLNEVIKASTSVSLSSTPNPAFVGAAVSFIATVTPPAATGTVQFLDGSSVLGTSTLAGGSASFSTSALTQGDHSITAVYSGDTSNAGSSSAVLSQAMRLSAGMTVGLNPSPGVTGRNVTLTANVVAAATGTVTFTDGGATLATVPIVAGTASYSTTSLTQGAHTIGIGYSGDSTYMSQSTTVAEAILGATSITVTSNANPAMPGQSIAFTATVTPPAASGSVQFYDGQTLVATAPLSAGTAGYATASLTPGGHSITANYLGSSDYAASFSNTLTQVIKSNTSVALTSNPNPSLTGAAVTFAATVTPATATGTVQFLDGTTVLGTSTLAGGSASFSTSALTPGAHSISAIYGGDTANAGATSATLFQSVKSSAGMTIAVSPSPAVSGQTVTIRANMNAAATGTATFLDGNTVLATVTVVSGTASYATSLLAPGTHMLGVSYSGDTNYTSASTTVQETVLASSSVALASSVNPSSTGQTVTFTAALTPASAAGTVQFLDGGIVVGTASLVSGRAVYSTSSLATGTHPITASYGGDANDTPANSPALTQTVKAVASVALTSSANPSTIGEAVRFTASIAPSTAIGTVQFLNGSTVIGTVAVTSGTAALTTSGLTLGTDSITATYSGDANNTAATSATLTQTVNPPPPTAPSDLAAKASGSHQIDLRWTASATSGVTYNVYASRTNGFTPLASNRIATGVTAVTYSATGLNPSTKYYFRVKAANAGGESAATNQAAAVTWPD